MIKKILPLVLAFVFAFSFSFSFADDIEDEFDSEPSPVIVNVDVYGEVSEALSDHELYLESVTNSTYALTSSGSGLKSLMLDLIGPYEALITDYEYRNQSSQYYSHSISIEKDWAWICSCGIFAIVLYSCLRFLYSFVKGV